MIRIVRFVLLALVTVIADDVAGKIPGRFYASVAGGVTFPGIASHGTPFIGKCLVMDASYIPKPDAKIGLELSAGLGSHTYRHYFDETAFVQQTQRFANLMAQAYIPAGKRCRCLVGINALVPLWSFVEIGERQFNQTYYYSNDTVTGRYNSTHLQVTASLAIDWSLGRSEQCYTGVRFSQAANAPVRSDALYEDANGNSVTMSRQMKAASIMLYLSFRLSGTAKRKNAGEEES